MATFNYDLISSRNRQPCKRLFIADCIGCTGNWCLLRSQKSEERWQEICLASGKSTASNAKEDEDSILTIERESQQNRRATYDLSWRTKSTRAFAAAAAAAANLKENPAALHSIPAKREVPSDYCFDCCEKFQYPASPFSCHQDGSLPSLPSCELFKCRKSYCPGSNYDSMSNICSPQISSHELIPPSENRCSRRCQSICPSHSEDFVPALSSTGGNPNAVSDPGPEPGSRPRPGPGSTQGKLCKSALMLKCCCNDFDLTKPSMNGDRDCVELINHGRTPDGCEVPWVAETAAEAPAASLKAPLPFIDKGFPNDALVDVSVSPSDAEIQKVFQGPQSALEAEFPHRANQKISVSRAVMASPKYSKILSAKNDRRNAPKVCESKTHTTRRQQTSVTKKHSISENQAVTSAQTKAVAPARLKINNEGNGTRVTTPRDQTSMKSPQFPPKTFENQETMAFCAAFTSAITDEYDSQPNYFDISDSGFKLSQPKACTFTPDSTTNELLYHNTAGNENKETSYVVSSCEAKNNINCDRDDDDICHDFTYEACNPGPNVCEYESKSRNSDPSKSNPELTACYPESAPIKSCQIHTPTNHKEVIFSPVENKVINNHTDGKSFFKSLKSKLHSPKRRPATVTSEPGVPNKTTETGKIITCTNQAEKTEAGCCAISTNPVKTKDSTELRNFSAICSPLVEEVCNRGPSPIHPVYQNDKPIPQEKTKTRPTATLSDVNCLGDLNKDQAVCSAVKSNLRSPKFGPIIVNSPADSVVTQRKTTTSVIFEAPTKANANIVHSTYQRGCSATLLEDWTATRPLLTTTSSTDNCIDQKACSRNPFGLISDISFTTSPASPAQKNSARDINHRELCSDITSKKGDPTSQAVVINTVADSSSFLRSLSRSRLKLISEASLTSLSVVTKPNGINDENDHPAICSGLVCQTCDPEQQPVTAGLPDNPLFLNSLRLTPDTSCKGPPAETKPEAASNKNDHQINDRYRTGHVRQLCSDTTRPLTTVDKSATQKNTDQNPCKLISDHNQSDSKSILRALRSKLQSPKRRPFTRTSQTDATLKEKEAKTVWAETKNNSDVIGGQSSCSSVINTNQPIATMKLNQGTNSNPTTCSAKTISSGDLRRDILLEEDDPRYRPIAIANEINISLGHGNATSETVITAGTETLRHTNRSYEDPCVTIVCEVCEFKPYPVSTITQVQRQVPAATFTIGTTVAEVNRENRQGCHPGGPTGIGSTIRGSERAPVENIGHTITSIDQEGVRSSPRGVYPTAIMVTKNQDYTSESRSAATAGVVLCAPAATSESINSPNERVNSSTAGSTVTRSYQDLPLGDCSATVAELCGLKKSLVATNSNTNDQTHPASLVLAATRHKTVERSNQDNPINNCLTVTADVCGLKNAYASTDSSVDQTHTSSLCLAGKAANRVGRSDHNNPHDNCSDMIDIGWVPKTAIPTTCSGTTTTISQTQEMTSPRPSEPTKTMAKSDSDRCSVFQTQVTKSPTTGTLPKTAGRRAQKHFSGTPSANIAETYVSKSAFEAPTSLGNTVISQTVAIPSRDAADQCKTIKENVEDCKRGISSDNVSIVGSSKAPFERIVNRTSRISSSEKELIGYSTHHNSNTHQTDVTYFPIEAVQVKTIKSSYVSFRQANNSSCTSESCGLKQAYSTDTPCSDTSVSRTETASSPERTLMASATRSRFHDYRPDDFPSILSEICSSRSPSVDLKTGNNAVQIQTDEMLLLGPAVTMTSARNSCQSFCRHTSSGNAAEVFSPKSSSPNSASYCDNSKVRAIKTPSPAYTIPAGSTKVSDQSYLQDLPDTYSRHIAEDSFRYESTPFTTVSSSFNKQPIKPEPLFPTMPIKSSLQRSLPDPVPGVVVESQEPNTASATAAAYCHNSGRQVREQPFPIPPTPARAIRTSGRESHDTCSRIIHGCSSPFSASTASVNPSNKLRRQIETVPSRTNATATTPLKTSCEMDCRKTDLKSPLEAQDTKHPSTATKNASRSSKGKAELTSFPVPDTLPKMVGNSETIYSRDTCSAIIAGLGSDGPQPNVNTYGDSFKCYTPEMPATADVGKTVKCGCLQSTLSPTSPNIDFSTVSTFHTTYRDAYRGREDVKLSPITCFSGEKIRNRDQVFGQISGNMIQSYLSTKKSSFKTATNQSNTSTNLTEVTSNNVPSRTALGQIEEKTAPKAANRDKSTGDYYHRSISLSEASISNAAPEDASGHNGVLIRNGQSTIRPAQNKESVGQNEIKRDSTADSFNQKTVSTDSKPNASTDRTEFATCTTPVTAATITVCVDQQAFQKMFQKVLGADQTTSSARLATKSSLETCEVRRRQNEVSSPATASAFDKTTGSDSHKEVQYIQPSFLSESNPSDSLVDTTESIKHGNNSRQDRAEVVTATVPRVVNKACICRKISDSVIVLELQNRQLSETTAQCTSSKPYSPSDHPSRKIKDSEPPGTDNPERDKNKSSPNGDKTETAHELNGPRYSYSVLSLEPSTSTSLSPISTNSKNIYTKVAEWRTPSDSATVTNIRNSTKRIDANTKIKASKRNKLSSETSRESCVTGNKPLVRRSEAATCTSPPVPDSVHHGLVTLGKMYQKNIYIAALMQKMSSMDIKKLVRLVDECMNKIDTLETFCKSQRENQRPEVPTADAAVATVTPVGVNSNKDSGSPEQGPGGNQCRGTVEVKQSEIYLSQISSAVLPSASRDSRKGATFKKKSDNPGAENAERSRERNRRDEFTASPLSPKVEEPSTAKTPFVSPHHSHPSVHAMRHHHPSITGTPSSDSGFETENNAIQPTDKLIQTPKAPSNSTRPRTLRLTGECPANACGRQTARCAHHERDSSSGAPTHRVRQVPGHRPSTLSKDTFFSSSTTHPSVSRPAATAGAGPAHAPLRRTVPSHFIGGRPGIAPTAVRRSTRPPAAYSTLAFNSMRKKRHIK